MSTTRREGGQHVVSEDYNLTVPELDDGGLPPAAQVAPTRLTHWTDTSAAGAATGGTQHDRAAASVSTVMKEKPPRHRVRLGDHSRKQRKKGAGETRGPFGTRRMGFDVTQRRRKGGNNPFPMIPPRAVVIAGRPGSRSLPLSLVAQLRHRGPLGVPVPGSPMGQKDTHGRGSGTIRASLGGPPGVQRGEGFLSHRCCRWRKGKCRIFFFLKSMPTRRVFGFCWCLPRPPNPTPAAGRSEPVQSSPGTKGEKNRGPGTSLIIIIFSLFRLPNGQTNHHARPPGRTARSGCDLHTLPAWLSATWLPKIRK